MLLVAAVGLAVAHAATTGDEFKAIRDDIRGICYKIYGDNGAKHCRQVSDLDTQRHIHHSCWKTGWSGQGNLQCKYGFEMYGENTQGHGDNAVHPGANGGRRRLQAGVGDPTGSGLAEEEREMQAVDPAGGNVIHSTTFKFDNFENVEQINRLGDYTFQTSFCFLQDITMYHDENVDPNCGVFHDEDGHWNLKMTSASCAAFCTPRGSL